MTEMISGRATDREYTDNEILSFVSELESLSGGDLTVALLVGCGQRAVGPLRQFLLNGRPRGIFQPRQRAVEALGQLGATNVLVEYLSYKRNIADAIVRFGEEAVESSAARELARWQSDEIFYFLLKLGQERMLPGVVDALGSFGRPEAAAVFLKALRDDVCRPIAEEALRRIARETKQELIAAARTVPLDRDETPSERQGRRSVVRILSDLDLNVAECNELKPLLEDQDSEIAIMAAEMALNWAPATDKNAAAQFLISRLDSAHWFMQIRIQECLCRNYYQVRELIQKTSTLRRQKAKGEPLADPVLRILERVQSRMANSGSRERKA